jgi:cytosine/adenosine deaminase-related metal-dependent hydrolase
MSETPPPQEEWTLTARWVLPVSGPPLARGWVTIAGDRIAAVGPHGSRTPDVDLGDVAVLPGLVNAHTHLDLSGMRGLAPPTPDFTGWLRQVVAHRRGRSPEQVQADVRAGLEESLRYGTTLIGDIAAGGASWDELVKAPLRAVVFFEMLGLPAERAEQTRVAAGAWLKGHAATEVCCPGLSPHAPYSVHANLFTEANEMAQEASLVLATHLAESAEEVELLEGHRGPFVAFLEGVGAWEPQGLVRGEAAAIRYCCEERVRTLLVHCNYLSPHTVISTSGTVVYCPRTHAAFGHPPHPFRDFLARGVRVALGTDSLASNPDLDLLAEARFLHHRYPDVPGSVVLRLATLSGAEALGWHDETGSLEPGKSADLVAVPLPHEDGRDPHELVLDSDRRVRRVLCRGRWLDGAAPGRVP